MKKITGWQLFATIIVIILVAGGFVQHYLTDNLVVSMGEHHEHAHIPESEPGEDGGGASTSTALGNLVANYSFEVGTDLAIDGWHPSGEDPGTSAWRDTSVHAFGSASAGLSSGSGSRGVDLVWTQSTASAPAEKDVIVKGLIKAEDLQGGAFLRIVGLQDSAQDSFIKTWYNLSSPEGTYDWSEVQGRVYLPAGVNHVELSVGLYGEGRVWFDEISLVSSEPAMTPLERETNLLVNPDFSQGLAGWNYFSVSGAPRFNWGVANGGGVHDSSLFLTQPQPVDPGYYSGFYQTVNDLYHTGDNTILTGWVKTSGLDGLAWLSLIFYCDDVKYVMDSPLALSGTQDWQQLRVGVVMPANVDAIMVRVSVSGQGTAFFDDLDFRLSPPGD